MKNFDVVFTRITHEAKLHARFLNTLSLMELYGAHKLARCKFLHGETFFLEHMAEEFRHAYFLRKLANKVMEQELSYSAFDLVQGKKARNYIYNLDRKISIMLNSALVLDRNTMQKYVYILTTFVVESRALPFYVSYQKILDEKEKSINIKSVISEEERHLSHIDTQIKEMGLGRFVEHALAIEAGLFDSWWNAILEDLSLSAA